MHPRVDPWLVWPRAFCVGAVAFTFGVVGHVTADGLLPGPLLLAVLFGLSVLLSVPMLARPAGRLRLVAMLVGGQMLVHLVLTLSAGHRGDVTGIASGRPVPAGLRSLPVVDGRRVGSLQDAYQGMSGQSVGATTPTLPIGHLVSDLSAHAPMMAVHLVAAAVVGLWLAYGERCLWTVLALTGRRVLAASWALGPVPGAPRPATRSAYAELPVVAASWWQARPHTRRGPPALAC